MREHKKDGSSPLDVRIDLRQDAAKHRLLDKILGRPIDSSQRYLLQEELGRGGAGSVYRAFDRVTKRTVALKVLRSASPDEETLRRFLAETEISSRLEHPGIIPVYDAGTLSDGRPFYTMREVNPLSLRDAMSRSDPAQSLSLHRLCSIFLQISNALAYAHSQHIIHRDLKPENILLGKYGEVYITDWGISKDISDSTSFSYTQPPREGQGASITEEGFIVGTPGYMSPEQITGNDPLDTRSDLFSLGVVLYELLTGRAPFVGSNSTDAMMRTLRVTPASPESTLLGCPPVLSEICMSLLSKSRDDRPQEATLVVAAIEFFLEEERAGAKREDEAERFAREARRHVQRAIQLSKEYSDLKKRELLERQLSRMGATKKKEVWFSEYKADSVKAELVSALNDASDLYLQALAHEPDSKALRQQIADLSLLQAKQAGEDFKDDLRQHYEQRAHRYDPESVALESL
jgi:serine/threonine protein kinase